MFFMNFVKNLNFKRFSKVLFSLRENIQPQVPILPILFNSIVNIQQSANVLNLFIKMQYIRGWI